MDHSEPDWIEYFGLLISAHHGLAVDALKETGFENAFRDACEAVGWGVDPPASATRRFVDITVQTSDGRRRRLSLKSTAAQRLSKSTIHISKLTEAAWIQDVRSARSRRTRTLELFEEYCATVDAIVMLRAFVTIRSPSVLLSARRDTECDLCITAVVAPVRIRGRGPNAQLLIPRGLCGCPRVVGQIRREGHYQTNQSCQPASSTKNGNSASTIPSCVR